MLSCTEDFFRVRRRHSRKRIENRSCLRTSQVGLKFCGEGKGSKNGTHAVLHSEVFVPYWSQSNRWHSEDNDRSRRVDVNSSNDPSSSNRRHWALFRAWRVDTGDIFSSNTLVQVPFDSRLQLRWTYKARRWKENKPLLSLPCVVSVNTSIDSSDWKERLCQRR